MSMIRCSIFIMPVHKFFIIVLIYYQVIYQVYSGLIFGLLQVSAVLD
jgi:hypothetical protein